MPTRAFKTIRALSRARLMKIDFVDVYGRNVGLSYSDILAEIKREFPERRTTRKALRNECNLYNSTDRQIRLPVRYRSRKIQAREFARSLLIQRDDQGVGLSLRIISDRTKRRFGERIPIRALEAMCGALVREGLKVPTR